MSWATDVLWPLLQDMGGGLGSFFGLRLDDVLKDPADWSPETADLIEGLSLSVVQPAATMVLVVLFMLELSRVAVRTDGDGEAFIKVAFFTLVKFALVKMVFDATPVVMGGIYEVFADLARASNVMTVEVSLVDRARAQPFLDSVADMDWLGQTMLVVLMLIAWLVNKGAVVLALALVVVRFVKLLIFTAFAPFPMAFFATQDTRQFAVGFLRNFGATVLQAFVMVLAFGIYQTVTAGWAVEAFTALPSNGLSAALSIGGNFIFMGVVLGMIMLGTGRISSELLGN